ncbi:hypothetical protein PENSPDRAFT_684742 [Peniophora sp. CONT]|nr:hypothetical protein PENSPDRAFT_684742 [Peniophora sp. CONT]
MSSSTNPRNLLAAARAGGELPRGLKFKKREAPPPDAATTPVSAPPPPTGSSSTMPPQQPAPITAPPPPTTAPAARSPQPPAPSPAPPPPAASSIMPPPPPAPSSATQEPETLSAVKLPDGYTAAAFWLHDEAVVTYGADESPFDPRANEDEGPFVGVDAWWGYYEWAINPQPLDHCSPHLPLIRVPDASAKETSWEFREVRDEDREVVLTEKEPGVMARSANIFVMKRDVHKPVGRHLKTLRALFNSVAALFRYTSTPLGERGLARLDASSRELLSHARIPVEQSKNMMILWGMMHWGRLGSRAEWNACWRGMQRAMYDVSAFIDMCGALLPDDLHPTARDLLELCRKRRREHDAVPGMSRRGVILAGKDTKFFPAFLRMGVPVHCLILQSQLGPAAKLVRPVGQLRCSARRSDQLNNFVLRELPFACYLPRRAPWHLFERVSRGMISLPGGPAPEPSKKAAKRKRNEDHTQRALTAQDTSAKAREAAFREAHPSLTMSSLLYKTIAWRSPAIRSHFDRLEAPLLPSAPTPISKFATGLQRALENVEVAEGTLAMTTFIPPVQLFTHAGPLRAARSLVMFVWLLPTILQRIELSHTDDAVRRFGSGGWKDILGGEHFYHGVPGEITWEQFWENPHQYWQYGGEDFWGKAENKRLKSTPGALPRLGVLPCGHEPKVDDLLNNPDAVASLLFSIGQLGLIDTLTFITKPSKLEKAGVPLVQEPEVKTADNGYDVSRLHKKPTPRRQRDPSPQRGPSEPKKKKQKARSNKGLGAKIWEDPHPNDDAPRPFKHYTPTIQALNGSHELLKRIRRIVMYDGHFDANGWPKFWSAESQDPVERRQWLTDLKEFLLKDAAYSKQLDDHMASKGNFDWIKIAELTNKWHAPSLNAMKQEQLEAHLLWRYSLTALKCGRVPAAFHHEPALSVRGQCAKCYAPPVVGPGGMDFDADTDNEEDAENGYSDWYWRTRR